jgi:hypothetical protein
MMGTKLVREGEFQAAINYLEQVPLSYISEQGISYYMAHKDYNQIIWMKRQFLSFLNEMNTPVKSNAKLQYCRDMVALDNQIANSSGEQRNELLYKKANMLYQASHKGDCWYLAHYQNGEYSEKLRSEYDFIGTARRLLVAAEHDAENIEFKQRCIFAQTFITGENFGSCVVRDYDWRAQKYTYSLDNDKYPHIRSIERLLDFASKDGNMNADTYFCPFSIVKHIDKVIEDYIGMWLNDKMPKHQTLGLADGATGVIVGNPYTPNNLDLIDLDSLWQVAVEKEMMRDKR